MAIQNSVLTNPASMIALRTMNGINRNLDVTQSRISTGLKVSNALDDASNFAISQGIRGELKSFDAVTQGLNNSKGVGKVALAGVTGIFKFALRRAGQANGIVQRSYHDCAA